MSSDYHKNGLKFYILMIYLKRQKITRILYHIVGLYVDYSANNLIKHKTNGRIQNYFHIIKTLNTNF